MEINIGYPVRLKKILQEFLDVGLTYATQLLQYLRYETRKINWSLLRRYDPRYLHVAVEKLFFTTRNLFVCIFGSYKIEGMNESLIDR